MGRRYFSTERSERANISILEVGCGSGANLWMLAREGFDVYGLDNSAEALKLCNEMLLNYNCNASLSHASMTEMPYENNSMDVIIDVFSSNCVDRNSGVNFLAEVRRVLKPDGCFFSYFPSKNSDAWQKAQEEDKFDDDTLKGIYRKESPFYEVSFLSVHVWQ